MISIQEAYKEFAKKTKPKGFLCSAFIMCDPDKLEEINWQLDFYNKEDDTIDSYTIKDDKVETLNLGSKPFRDKDQKIEELNLKNIKISCEVALKLAEKENKEGISKIIIILQKTKKEIWNISFFTTSFNLINVKIDAKNKKILEKTNTPLIKF